MNHPNFSGTWLFSPELSILEITLPESSSFEIIHNEPIFILKRTFIFNKKPNEFSITLTTDNKKVLFIRDGREMESSLYWENNTLVFYTIIILDNDRAINLVKYNLSSDGQQIIADEIFTSMNINYKNKWVLIKA